MTSQSEVLNGQREHVWQAVAQRRKLLIIEPDTLLRWSIMSYLKSWFDVILADSAPHAREWLTHMDVDAMVVSGELPTKTLEQLYEWSDSGERCRGMIVTITSAEPASRNGDANRNTIVYRKWRTLPNGQDQSIQFIEKPFKLRDLANLLGVSEQYDDESSSLAMDAIQCPLSYDSC